MTGVGATLSVAGSVAALLAPGVPARAGLAAFAVGAVVVVADEAVAAMEAARARVLDGSRRKALRMAAEAASALGCSHPRPVWRDRSGLPADLRAVCGPDTVVATVRVDDVLTVEVVHRVGGAGVQEHLGIVRLGDDATAMFHPGDPTNARGAYDKAAASPAGRVAAEARATAADAWSARPAWQRARA